MKQFDFKISGLGDQNFRWRKKFNRHSVVSGSVLVWTTLIVATIYSTSYPGRINIDSPINGMSTNDSIITVSGTVEGIRANTVTLNVNGSLRSIQVQNNAFSSTVPLIPGENTIQAAIGGIAPSRSARPAVLKVTADIPILDIWTELTWDGAGDIDLHLHLPNGDVANYLNQTVSGASLDIDNTERDGPEHIVMEKAIPGEYSVRVHYYSASEDDPLRTVAWQVNIRLRAGDVENYQGVLRAVEESTTVNTFIFP